VIALANLSKRFGNLLAVDALDLDVRPGDIYGLLGHNGAGKSTAIGMMLGQVWPSQGTVHIDGFNVVTQRRQALRHVGAIFETPVFYDYLSGWRNLEILSAYTAPTSSARRREVVAWVGLTGREQHRVKTYSHGMRARLALAQALLPQPRLLILDEPSDGLDPEGIHEMRQTILRLRQELNLTILLSSHLLNEVEQLCNRIAVMNRGRKVFEGTLADAQAAQIWVRLRVGDFAAARQRLRAAHLIVDSRDDQYIALSPGIGTEQVVRHLVAADISVYEIAVEKRSLEDFYLTLMKAEK